MHQFITHHAEFDGFSDYFNREVYPTLAERDAVRSKAVRKGVIGGLLFSSLFLAVSIFGLVLYQNIFVGGFFGFFALISGFVVFSVVTNSIREETKGRIVNAIVGYIGWSFDPDASGFALPEFQELFLLPKRADRQSFEDGLSGTAHGAAFRSIECHLENKTRDKDGDTKWKTVFFGQLMILDFPTKTFGRTIVLRDRGWFNPKKRADMKRIGLVDPVFEKAFEAYGTDQVEGRVILNPDFMQRMVDLEQAVSGKNIRFGFDSGKLYIAVETGNQFEAGSMFTALTKPDRTQKILDEVGAVFDIVDTLLDRPVNRYRR